MIKLSKYFFGDEEIKAVQSAFDDGYLGMGKIAFEFEKELKAYLKTTKDVVCVNSATSALHLAVASLDIGPGDEVLGPSITYVASFQAVSATGAKPVACDVKLDTFSIDLDSAKQHLSKKTRAIMPVHYGSHVESPKEIYAFAKEHGLRVIEDAAHAFGTVHDGELVGAQGDIICFSFDGIKNIKCAEGGAVVTGDQALLERLRDGRFLSVEKDSLKRAEGKRSWDFDVKHQGFRYHMSNVMAAIGRAQLRKVDAFKKRRQEIMRYYVKELTGVPSLTLLKLDYDNIMPHVFVIRVLDNKRDGLQSFLAENGIETGVHYKPNHLLTKYKTDYALKNSEQAYQEMLTIPLHVGLQEEEVKKVVDKIKEYLV